MERRAEDEYLEMGGRASLDDMLDQRSIRRLPNGVIDVDFYKKHSLALRARWLRRFIGRIVGWLRHRSEVAALHALDERSLRDMGITRSDIPSIASGTYFRDESRRQRMVRACAES